MTNGYRIILAPNASLLTREGVDIHTIVQVIYAATDTRLHKLATLSVTAHLHKLEREGKVKLVNSERDGLPDYWALV